MKLSQSEHDQISLPVDRRCHQHKHQQNLILERKFDEIEERKLKLLFSISMSILEQAAPLNRLCVMLKPQDCSDSKFLI